MDKQHTLIKNFLKNHSLVESNILSFNDFVDNRMQVIAKEVAANLSSEDIKVEVGKIKVGRPNIIEADGSRHNLLPAEARMRNLTYSAPVHMEITIKKDDESEHCDVEIGRMPIMVRSKYCHLHNMTDDQLIENHIDPADPGGYFTVNGNERILVLLEDLASNQPFINIDSKNKKKKILRLFSQRGSYKIPTSILEATDGILEISFSRFKNIPLIPLIKSLGVTKDADIAKLVGVESDSFVVNLYEYTGMHSALDALNFIVDRTSMLGTKKEVQDKLKTRIDSYLLPHIGVTPESRVEKAVTLCKLMKQFFVAKQTKYLSDKDHYANKRVKLSGDLFTDLFRINLTMLLRDLQNNLIRLAKKKKIYSLMTLAKATLFTQRIESAIATGSWIGERTGVTKNMDKTNFLSIFSDLQRVISLLPSEQENFKARTLHPTHYGRFCPIETPEGTPIGLRKNLALLSKISTAVDLDSRHFVDTLKEIGMEVPSNIK
ncbi:DNA-directed RNA polymerase subunit B'' [Nanoarchaeota archaeon]